MISLYYSRNIYWRYISTYIILLKRNIFYFYPLDIRELYPNQFRRLYTITRYTIYFLTSVRNIGFRRLCIITRYTVYFLTSVRNMGFRRLYTITRLHYLFSDRGQKHEVRWGFEWGSLRVRTRVRGSGRGSLRV